MGIGKWISGILGWALAGPIGALLGFSLGALFHPSDWSFVENAVAQALKIIKELLGKEIDLPAVCAQIKAHMDIPQRLQLLHYLIGIAKADGHVSRAELDTLKSIALYLGISRQESDSLFAMYRNTLDDAYKVLEITPDATDDEVKKAYKQMAFKHHPDRVESLGADVKKAAEEKFKAIAAAYEAIKKERGFN